MLVEPRTHVVVTNGQPSEDARSVAPGSFAGVLPPHEGLAEYTGIKLASPQPARQRQLAARGLESGERTESFVRSFAYASGPAYGLLLDAAGSATWRQRARAGEDLGGLLGQACRAAS